jgi:hypothetical protein
VFKSQWLHFHYRHGGYSCGKLIASIGKAPLGSHSEMNTGAGIFIDEHTQYQEWLMGFVTGYNFAYSSPADEPPSKQVTEIDQAGADLWMRNWCNKHPTQTVFQGASALRQRASGSALSHAV